MTQAIQPTAIIPILVTSDWTDASNAAADVINSLETSFPGVWSFPALGDLGFSFLYKKDAGYLYIASGGVVGIWFGAFTPTIGDYVYLLDIYG
jgi:hypothetical protein